MGLRRRWSMRNWLIWSLPRPVLAVILLVELVVAATLGVRLLDGVGPLPASWSLVVVLAAAGLVSTEASLGVERVRQQTDESPHIDLSSVWAFAAAVLLPGGLASVVVLVIYVHMYFRVWRRAGVPPHRVLFTTATVVLAVQAAALVIERGGGPDPFHSTIGLISLLGALLTYAVINMVLIVAVIVLSGPNRTLGTFLQVLGHGDDAALELATLSMGALAAGAISSFGAAYALLVLPPLIVLHRTVLVRQLEKAASTDSKTGLLNAAAWRVQAERVLRRFEQAERIPGSATVLVLDLDHFKLVNDRHGHLVGDQVLAAVAAAVRAEVRDDDIVGRFGGEEFVVLLSGGDGEPGSGGAEAAAQRIRHRVAALEVPVSGPYGPLVVDELSVSIGGATCPEDGTGLAELIEVADTAMYAAKRAGRNTVRMGVAAVRRADGPVER